MAYTKFNRLNLIVNSPNQDGGIKDFKANGQDIGSLIGQVNGVVLQSTGAPAFFLSANGTYTVPRIIGITEVFSVLGEDKTPDDYINYSEKVSTTPDFIPISSSVDLTNPNNTSLPFDNVVEYTTTAPYLTLLETEVAVAQTFKSGDIITIITTTEGARYINGVTATVTDIITTGPINGIVIEYDSVGKGTGTGTFKKLNQFTYSNALTSDFNIANIPIGPTDFGSSGLGTADVFDQVESVAGNTEECILTKTSGTIVQRYSKFILVKDDSSTENKYVGIAEVTGYPSSGKIQIRRPYFGTGGSIDSVSGTIEFVIFTPVVFYTGTPRRPFLVDFGLFFDGNDITQPSARIELKLFGNFSTTVPPYSAIEFPIIKNTLLPNEAKLLEGKTLIEFSQTNSFFICQSSSEQLTNLTRFPYARVYGVE